MSEKAASESTVGFLPVQRFRGAIVSRSSRTSSIVCFPSAKSVCRFARGGIVNAGITVLRRSIRTDSEFRFVRVRQRERIKKTHGHNWAAGKNEKSQKKKRSKPSQTISLENMWSILPVKRPK